MDQYILLLINGHHTAFLDEFMYLLSQKTVWVPMYLTLLYIVWRNYSWKGLGMLAVMVGVGMFFTDWLNSHVIRMYFERLRPNNPESAVFHSLHLVKGCRGGGFGFPSAHSANFWLLALMMMHWFRNARLSFYMGIVALLVCYSRVYMGYHYPGDILGGLILASIVMWALSYIHEDMMKFTHVKEARHVNVAVYTIIATLLCFAGTALYHCL